MSEATAIQKVDTAQAPAVASDDGAVILSIIDRMVNAPDIPVEKIERMLDMHERMQREASRRAYHAALAEMQSEMPTVVALGKITGDDKNTPGAKVLRSKYAKWEDVNEAIRPVLCKHGFALSFRITQPQPDRVSVTAVLSHRGGHSEETSLHLPNDPSGGKNNVQAWGSSVSYGKRYTAFAMLNIAARGEDDDGKSADAPPPATEDKRAEMAALIREVNGDAAWFCERYSVETLDDLTGKQVEGVIAALKKRVALKKQQEAKS